MPSLAPDAAKAMIAEFLSQSPFAVFMGMNLEEIDIEAGRITVTMPARPELMRGTGADGMFHGGPIAALIDTAGDFAVAVAAGGIVPTINFRVDYLRPAIGDKLTAVATLRKAGRTVALADVDVFDSQQRLCAVGRGTYSGQAG